MDSILTLVYYYGRNSTQLDIQLDVIPRIAVYSQSKSIIRIPNICLLIGCLSG